jgi:hypothetical protein
MPRKPVTDRTIMQLKKKALRRTRTNQMDVEAGNEKTQSRVGKAVHNVVDTVKKPFSKWWWDDLLEKSDGEALVDGSLLSYSYLREFCPAFHPHLRAATIINTFRLVSHRGGNDRNCWMHDGLLCHLQLQPLHST